MGLELTRTLTFNSACHNRKNGARLDQRRASNLRSAYELEIQVGLAETFEIGYNSNSGLMGKIMRTDGNISYAYDPVSKKITIKNGNLSMDIDKSSVKGSFGATLAKLKSLQLGIDVDQLGGMKFSGRMSAYGLAEIKVSASVDVGLLLRMSHMGITISNYQSMGTRMSQLKAIDL